MKRVTCLVAGLMLFTVFAAAQAPPAGQGAIALVRAQVTDFPLQYGNFRD